MLTEKEKMQRARLYLLKLQKGVDPISGKPLEDDAVLNSERMKRFFDYLFEVLGRDLQALDAQERKPQKRSRRQPFYITDEELKRVRLPETDCMISEFVKAVNEAVNDDSRKRLGARAINAWLVDKGYLKNDTDEMNRTRRSLTEKAAELGIYSRQGMGARGPYTIILHSKQSQDYLLAHLQEIIQWNEEDEDDISGNGDL